MSESLAQPAFLTRLESRFHAALKTLARLPLSFWRGLLMLLAGLWLAYSLSTFFWLVFPVPEAPQPTKLAPPLDTVGAGNTAPQVSFESLSALQDAFGSSQPIVAAQMTPTPEPELGIDAATTKLSLKLHGVFISNDNKQGSAIIANGNEQNLYTIEDEIKGNQGVKLARVLDKRVILDNKGKYESLWLFSEEDFTGIATNYSESAPEPDADPQRASPYTVDTPQPPAGYEVPPRNRVTRTARADQVPTNIGDVIRFSVHREGGEMVGYRIRPGRDQELFTQVGLQPNDIVTSVNGIQVNDPTQIREVYKSMKTATEAQLTVLRDGEVHLISISLDSGA